MPRIGIAWAVRPKTVIRGGYGWFFNTVGTNLSNTLQTGFSQSTPIQATLDNGLTYPAQLHDPFPNGLLAPLGAAGGFETNLGQGISYYRERRLQPYAQRWSFGLQQEFPFRVMLEGPMSAPRRGVDQPACEQCRWAPEPVGRDQATISSRPELPNPFRGTNQIYGANISRANLTALPHFGGITLVDFHSGYSWYHSLRPASSAARAGQRK